MASEGKRISGQTRGLAFGKLVTTAFYSVSGNFSFLEDVVE